LSKTDFYKNCSLGSFLLHVIFDHFHEISRYFT
jgi:hypothetical protein